MAQHQLTVKLGETSQQAHIEIDGMDVTHYTRAVSIHSAVGCLTEATLRVFASDVEAMNIPADITIQPVATEAAKPFSSPSEAAAVLIEHGYTVVRLGPGQRVGIIDATDPEDNAVLISKLQEMKRELEAERG